MLERKVFHESWYRIAECSLALRPSVRVTRQYYRGVLWFVLYEPFTNQYFRLSQATYAFVSRLNLNITVGELWQKMLAQNQKDMPGQGEVIEILTQLYGANLLFYGDADDASQLFERRSKQEKKKVQATLLNIFFLRIPVFDPEALLCKIKPLIDMLISKFMLIVWLITIGVAIKLGLENIEAITDQAQGILAPDNLFMLYISMVFIKLLHEFGHASVVKKYGGEVHTLGIMFMLLAPLPYVDATASWSFRQKRHRVLVGAGGMIFEFFLAAIALIIWANLGGGPGKALAYNVFFIASVSTLLFNANPLMRFDGYYILSDLTDTPNLQKQAVNHIKYVVEHYVFGRQNTEAVAHTNREAFLLFFYGVASFIYRIILFTGIIIGISRHFLILSVIMALMLFVSMILVPLGKFVKYVSRGPELALVRSRAMAISFSIIGGILTLFFMLPVSDGFTAPGVVEAKKYENVVVLSSGTVKQVLKQNGELVERGDTLLLMQNTELLHLLEQKSAEILETEFRYARALHHSPENMLPIKRRLKVLRQEREELQRDQRNLAICAPIAGVWNSHDIEDFVHKNLHKGDSLGLVLNPDSFDFVAVVSQEEVARIFADSLHGVQVRLKGNAFTQLYTTKLQAIPVAGHNLPSEALGFSGGGNIATQWSGYGMATAEPIYQVRAALTEHNPQVPRLHGRSGKVRFALHSNPLGLQLVRKIRQALQKHYRV